MSTPLGQQLRADAAWVLFQILEKGMSSKQALGQRKQPKTISCNQARSRPS